MTDRTLLVDGSQDRVAVLDTRIVDFAQRHGFKLDDDYQRSLMHCAKQDAGRTMSELTDQDVEGLSELSDSAVEWLNDRPWGQIFFVEDSCLWSELDYDGAMEAGEAQAAYDETWERIRS